MDRISDDQLDILIDFLVEDIKTEKRPVFFVTHSALVELRERRKANHGVVKFKWVCRCGNVNLWTWGMVEYVKWVPTSMECDKCHKETMMIYRPEVVHGQD
jgi:hypothetical protein